MDRLLDDNNIQLNLPVKISYQVLEDLLRDKLKNEEIGMKDTHGEVKNYAEILDVSLEKSRIENFDLSLNLKLKTLTTILKNKKVNLWVHISLGFDEAEQTIEVKKYELEGQSKSWLIDNSLEALANNLIYKKLKNKMKFDLKPQISSQLAKVNQKLEGELETAEGVFLSGNVNNLKVAEIISGDSLLLILLEIRAYGFINIKEIKF